MFLLFYHSPPLLCYLPLLSPSSLLSLLLSTPFSSSPLSMAAHNLKFWAFGESYNSTLPPHINFDITTGFLTMKEYLTTTLADKCNAANAATTDTALLAGHPLPKTIHVAQKIATYTSDAQRRSWIKSVTGDHNEVANYSIGVTISSASREWPAGRKTVGLVCSSMSNVVRTAAGNNDWHVVGMAREGKDVWIHNSEYIQGSYNLRPNRTSLRLRDVRGLSILISLIKTYMPTVEFVYLQGPPKGFQEGLQQCMGRSIAWVEAVATREIPWPPHNDGGVWTKHYLN